MLSAFLFTLVCTPYPIQQSTAELAPERLERVIEELAREIETTYVFPERGVEYAERLRERLFDGAYEDLSIPALAARLTADLQAVHKDGHLRVEAAPTRSSAGASAPAPSEADFQAAARRENFGFRKVEILDGNVGYLDLRGFTPLEFGRETAAGAMAFLANTDALIFDLRANGGGEPSMIQFLTTYLFAERTHLNSFEWRGREGLEEYWTFDEVPGKRLVDVPVFVLTSRRTYSAAEEFAYDLRNLERATLVGETTGGGAHPGDTHVIEDLLTVFIPQGRAINPITKTNWEGVGVEPHVAVAAAEALDTALREARKVLAERRAPAAR